MQISGNIPPYIAQAYGLPKARPAPPSPAAAQTQQTAPIGKIEAVSPKGDVRQVEATQDLSSIAGVQRPTKIDALVAGTVHRPITFDGAATPTPSAAGSLQLYTRAADKVEAAVAVNLGRSLDVTG